MEILSKTGLIQQMKHTVSHKPKGQKREYYFNWCVRDTKDEQNVLVLPFKPSTSYFISLISPQISCFLHLSSI